MNQHRTLVLGHSRPRGPSGTGAQGCAASCGWARWDAAVVVGVDDSAGTAPDGDAAAAVVAGDRVPGAGLALMVGPSARADAEALPTALVFWMVVEVEDEGGVAGVEHDGGRREGASYRVVRILGRSFDERPEDVDARAPLTQCGGSRRPVSSDIAARGNRGDGERPPAPGPDGHRPDLPAACSSPVGGQEGDRVRRCRTGRAPGSGMLS